MSRKSSRKPGNTRSLSQRARNQTRRDSQTADTRGDLRSSQPKQWVEDVEDEENDVFCVLRSASQTSQLLYGDDGSGGRAG